MTRILFIAVIAAGLSPIGCGGREGPSPSAPGPEKPGPEVQKPPAPAPPPLENRAPAQGEAPAQQKPQPVPDEWNPGQEQIQAAPEIAYFQADPYTWRFNPEPTREILAGKVKVFNLARTFFKGAEAESAEARTALVKLGLPTAKYLVELAGLFVPKAERPVPDPESWDIPETPEDKALEVVKDIQDGFLKTGEMKRLMSYFAAATGRTIDLDAKFIDLKREFRSFRVHPIPALWRVGDDLGCDTRVIAPDSTVVSLFLPVLMDMKVHEEDARWLLESLARLGKFEAELAGEVGGPVTLRVRADSYSEAFNVLAEAAGFSVEKTGKGFRVFKAR